jgi:hypothetical protein
MAEGLVCYIRASGASISYIIAHHRGRMTLVRSNVEASRRVVVPANCCGSGFRKGPVPHGDQNTNHGLEKG